MQTSFKYYKYIDTSTGEVKKDISIINSRLAIKAKRKVEADNSLTTINEEKFHIVSENKPQVKDVELQEITKEEFDALPESSLADARRYQRAVKVKEHRDRVLNKIEKIKERRLEIKNKVTPVDSETFTQLQEKQSKGESISAEVVEQVKADKNKKDKKDK